MDPSSGQQNSRHLPRPEVSTSSPRYPQSNGKAENAVKTVKRLFKKCQASGQSEYLALLDWRNTPTEGIGTSPAQRFLGQRCKTLLPMAGLLLKPQYATEKDTGALQTQKQRQQFYYNRQAHPLKPITPGETIRMQLPGQTTWTAGVCKEVVGPRSYDVQVGESRYRRNRQQLLRTNELPTDTSQGIVTPTRDSSGGDHQPKEAEVPMPTVSQQPGTTTSTAPPQFTMTSPVKATVPSMSPDKSTDPRTSPAQPPLRRSGRTRKPPAWMSDYVPS